MITYLSFTDHSEDEVIHSSSKIGLEPDSPALLGPRDPFGEIQGWLN
jgi:hypothetical protein